MSSTQIATVIRATEVIADNAARRIADGATVEAATVAAINEFSARWPKLGAQVATLLAVAA